MRVTETRFQVVNRKTGDVIGQVRVSDTQMMSRLKIDGMIHRSVLPLRKVSYLVWWEGKAKVQVHIPRDILTVELTSEGQAERLFKDLRAKI